MKRHAISAIPAGVLLAAITVSLPVDAGGGRGKSSVNSGHRVVHHGVAIFNRNTRNLPNGVGIFSRRPPALHTHGGKSVNGGLRKKHRVRDIAQSNPGAGKKTKRGRIPVHPSHHGLSHDAKKVREDHGHSRYMKKKHGDHRKRRVVYGSTVYPQVPMADLYYPEGTDEENCRSLTERGYDLSGRRVLVEWTLCFDEQGEAYLPEDGRRIVARY